MRAGLIRVWVWGGGGGRRDRHCLHAQTACTRPECACKRRVHARKEPIVARGTLAMQCAVHIETKGHMYDPLEAAASLLHAVIFC
eukprot:363933-Chlamydomonas_euryale.AAC.7